MKSRVIHGDCLDVMRGLEAASVDALCSDPPAGISFMGKAWDSDKGGRAQWVAWLAERMAEALRVLKPGAHGLVWSLPRTSHWTATALEDAGFEVRDCVTHLFGTGFPKSLDVSKAIDTAAGAEREVVGKKGGRYATPKQDFRGGKHHAASGVPSAMFDEITAPATDAAKRWEGWGTALKPAAEFWWLVRKPLEGTVAANVLRHGTGGLNVDGCRIAGGPSQGGGKRNTALGSMNDDGWKAKTQTIDRTMIAGRWPANVVFDEDAARALDAQSGVLHARGNKAAKKDHAAKYNATSYKFGGREHGLAGDAGGASRFFFVAKPSPSEKGEENKHPTVKAVALMRYLARLITPPGGLVLDPFAGSGTTGIACALEGFDFLGIEAEPEFAELARKRIADAEPRQRAML